MLDAEATAPALASATLLPPACTALMPWTSAVLTDARLLASPP